MTHKEMASDTWRDFDLSRVSHVVNCDDGRIDASPIQDVEGELIPFLGQLDVALDKKDLAIEIGMGNGGTHVIFRRMFGKVISIDMNFGIIGIISSLIKEPERSEFVWGNSINPATAHVLKKHLDGRKADFLFIDGDHSYASVSGDWILYREFVRVGGIVGFHDARGMPDVVRFLAELRSGHPLADAPITMKDIHRQQGISYYVVEGEE
jgi:predicted O-methyltransferase YrrM